MTGRAEIYKVVPGVTVNAGRGVGPSASLSLVPECGAVRVAVGVPASALRPAGRRAVGREDAAGAMGRRLWGALSRASLAGREGEGA